MSQPVILALAFLCISLADGQSIKKAPRKIPGAEKPTCSPGAICFSGQVSAGEEFRKALNSELDFVLQPGWTIAVVPKHPEADCVEFASVVNAPYRAHRSLYIDMSYGWTAEEEVGTSPREFSFVVNCPAYRIESERLNIVMWPYTTTEQKAQEALAKLGSSPSGKGRLWITGSKISHADDTPDEKEGKILSMKFSVEITLPRR